MDVNSQSTCSLSYSGFAVTFSCHVYLCAQGRYLFGGSGQLGPVHTYPFSFENAKVYSPFFKISRSTRSVFESFLPVHTYTQKRQKKLQMPLKSMRTTEFSRACEPCVYVWTGKNDSKTLRVDGEILKNGL